MVFTMVSAATLIHCNPASGKEQAPFFQSNHHLAVINPDHKRRHRVQSLTIKNLDFESLDGCVYCIGINNHLHEKGSWASQM